MGMKKANRNINLNLNGGEASVLKFIRKSREAVHLELIQADNFPDEPGTIRTRNALRRLVKDGLVCKVDRGMYEAVR